MDDFARLMEALNRAGVRCVVIGVWGANYYAHAGTVLFATHDRDLLLPPDPANLLAAWQVCEGRGLALWAAADALDRPRDLALARSVVERRSTTRASDGHGLDVDLSLDMTGFDFEEVWGEHRVFSVEGIDIPVARLRHIVESKARTGREKDRLFLATHADALEKLLPED